MLSPLRLIQGHPKSKRRGIAYIALPLYPPSLNLTLAKDCNLPEAGLGIWMEVFRKADMGRGRIQGPTSPFSSQHLNLSQRSLVLRL